MDVLFDGSVSYEAAQRRARGHSPETARELDVHINLLHFADKTDELRGAPGRWRWDGDGFIQSTIANCLNVRWRALNEQGDPTTTIDDVAAVQLQDIREKDSP